MKARSLRLELTAAAVVLIGLALLLSGIGLVLIFDKVLDTRTADELNHTAKYIAGQVSVGANDQITVSDPPADPRFANPYGGLYWQVTSPVGHPVRSRSLWDKTLVLPANPSKPLEHHETVGVPGPDGSELIAVVRTVELEQPKAEPPLVILVAMDRRELAASRRAFLNLLVPSLVALGLALSLAMVVFLHRALSPFRALRVALRDVHEGRRTLLPGQFPAEVQPLVEDLNRLIGMQEAALERARTQAGDMAHGLKTPLAILSAIARRKAEADPATSQEIDEQATAMERQVERALMRARVAAAATLRRRSCALASVIQRVRAVQERLPGSSDLDWIVDVPASLTYPADEGDATEMLGNLLDNARKWASGRVRVAGRAGSAGHTLTVEDDGPGMGEAEIAGIGRGQRWDETTPGTGFGMAITRDLVEATGGVMELSRSELGGLRAVIRWPAAGSVKPSAKVG